MKFGSENIFLILSTVIICSVISTPASTNGHYRIKRLPVDAQESAGEPNSNGLKFLFDTGYGSRIQTGSQLAKWKELSDYVYGAFGPGRKRSASPPRPYLRMKTVPEILQEENAVITEQDIQQLKYAYSLICTERLELFWDQVKHTLEFYMELEDILENLCLF